MAKDKTTLLFPCEYGQLRKVSSSFEEEYTSALSTGLFNIGFFNYDEYIAGDSLQIHIADGASFRTIYRGWMLKPEQYRQLLDELSKAGYKLLTSDCCYERLHRFPEAYLRVVGKARTPKIRVFSPDTRIFADVINDAFSSFMIKDEVKSAKGTSFPSCIETPIGQNELDSLVERFISFRGDLLTGGLVFKEYVDLKRYGDKTNEWRAFYLYGELLTLCRNSNQPHICKGPDEVLWSKFESGMDGVYYTVDFAETTSGEWIVVETGDGQVSGLATEQDFFSYYMNLGEKLVAVEDDKWGHPDGWDFMGDLDDASGGVYTVSPSKEEEQFWKEHSLRKAMELMKQLGLPRNETLTEEQLEQCRQDEQESE